jgi:hypothetical protein
MGYPSIALVILKHTNERGSSGAVFVFVLVEDAVERWGISDGQAWYRTMREGFLEG